MSGKNKPSEKEKSGMGLYVTLTLVAAATIGIGSYVVPSRTTDPTKSKSEYAVRPPMDSRPAKHKLPEESVTIDKVLTNDEKAIRSFQIHVDPIQYSFLKQYENVWCEVDMAMVKDSKMFMNIHKNKIHTSPIKLGRIPIGTLVGIYANRPGIEERLDLYETNLKARR